MEDLAYIWESNIWEKLIYFSHNLTFRVFAKCQRHLAKRNANTLLAEVTYPVPFDH